MTPSAQPAPADAPAPECASPVQAQAPGTPHAHGPGGAAHPGAAPGYPYGPPAHPGAAPGYPYGPPAYAYPPPGRFTAFMLRTYGRFPMWAAPAAILACFLGSAALVLWSDPTRADAASTSSCLVKLTTGMDCPGCGGTRAFWYLLHGNLPAAARHHAIAVFAAPFLVYAYVAWAGNRVFGTRLPQLRVSPRAVSWFLGAWALFSVARNLPWAPFTWFYV